MKILQVCAVDFTLYHFLVPLIRGMADAGHEVVAACADGPLAARVRSDGIRVEAIPFSRSLLSPRRHWRAYRALVRLIRREGFDMVHVHTPVAALIGRLAARRAGVKRIVYTAHGFYFHERMPAWKRWPFVALEWLGGRLTDVLLTQAAEDAETARRLGLCRGGVIEAIGNGVDATRFRPAADAVEKREVRARFETPADAVVVAVVGRLVAEKGYPELLRAMRAVDAVLWVIGARLENDHALAVEEEIAAALADPDLGPRLRLLGQRDDVEAILRGADIFTLPSHREGMPRSILEAMMSGLAVVATDIRGSREEVVEGETGLLVPVNDAAALAAALNRLAGDADLRARLGAAGLARARALYDERRIVARQLHLLALVPAEAEA